MPILGVIASQISGRLFAPSGAYDSIATVTVGAGGANTVSFTSIPSTYKHLQIRMFARDSRTSTLNNASFQINGDTATNYAAHALYADGTSVSSFGAPTQNLAYVGTFPSASTTASVFGVSVTDVLDYTNTNKYKTFKALTGFDSNGAGSARLFSGLWMSTSAITSITFKPEGSGDFVQYSHFALYGIKGE
jgi:hypothetical protein